MTVILVVVSISHYNQNIVRNRYHEERGSNQVLLCSLLPGNTFQCTERMDGKDRQAGFDSHYSPKGHEIIVFESAQILPRYVITFSQDDQAKT